MREIKRLPVAEISRDENQPRKHFGEDELLYLGQSMQDVGQQIPVIIYPNGKGYTLCDGERRWRGAQLVGLTTVDAIVLPEKPTATALSILQMSLEAHKVGLSAMERSNLLAKIQKENSWSVSDLAANLHMKQPLVSKLLKFQTLSSDVQKLLHAGTLDTEKAFIISQEPDAAKQLALAKLDGVSRDQLRQRVKSKGTAEAKSPAARFAMPGGMLVSLQGRDLTLTLAIEVLQEAVKFLKKGLAQGLNIHTQSKVMADQARKS